AEERGVAVRVVDGARARVDRDHLSRGDVAGRGSRAPVDHEAELGDRAAPVAAAAAGATAERIAARAARAADRQRRAHEGAYATNARSATNRDGMPPLSTRLTGRGSLTGAARSARATDRDGGAAVAADESGHPKAAHRERVAAGAAGAGEGSTIGAT